MILSFRRWPLATAAALSVPAILLGQSKKTPTRPEVTELTIQGVKSVDRADFSSSLKIDQSRCKSLALKPFCLVSKSPLFFQRAYLDHEELARDVVRARVFYFLRGYRDTQVDTAVIPDGRSAVRVTLTVHEGLPTVVSAINVQQKSRALDTGDVSDRLALKAGRPLNMFELDTTRSQLRDRLWEKGYADAIVDTATVIDTAQHAATINITITPRWVARVADIRVDGNKDIGDNTILRSLSFKPGDVYRRSDLLTSQRTLYESNLFRRASVALARPARRDSVQGDSARRAVTPSDSATLARTAGDSGRPRVRTDSLKHLVVTVAEAPPRAARVSAGFNTIDFVQVEGRYTNYNWFGGARQLNVQAAVGNLLAQQLNGSGIFYDVSKTTVGADASKYYQPTFNVGADVRQRWVGSPRNDIAGGVFAHRQSAPGVYVDQGYGVTATFTRRLMERWPVSLNYRFEITSVDAGNVYFCVAFGVCDAPTLDALSRYQRLSPLALTTSRDEADDPYEPRRGYRARLDLEHASAFTLSDFRYNRASGEVSKFLPIGRESVLGAHIRLGYVKALASTADALDITNNPDADELLHPRKRFYSGGASSVRGFQENQLGPRVLTVSPSKLRGPVDTLTGLTACPPSTPIAQCATNTSYLADRDFDARPLGGNMVAEGSLEFRFPIPLLTNLIGAKFLGAAFVDGGILAQNTNKALPRSKAAVTPGVGIRYISPVGPIRVDVGINPLTREELTVLTEDVVNGQRTLVQVDNPRVFLPVSGILSRLSLHLAIGEAF